MLSPVSNITRLREECDCMYKLFFLGTSSFFYVCVYVCMHVRMGRGSDSVVVYDGWAFIPYWLDFVFIDNVNLVSVFLPTSLVTIPYSAFDHCSVLQTMTIPT